MLAASIKELNNLPGLVKANRLYIFPPGRANSRSCQLLSSVFDLLCPAQALQSKVEKLQQHQGKGSLSQQTEDELEGLRALLRCNVCHERQKDVIITKCMHMFCRPCIQRNLDSRSRKCPGCGAAFGTKDVHQFYFT